MEYRGDVYADGVLFEPLPYRSAIEEGFTHILVLRTRPSNAPVQDRVGVYEKWIAGPYFHENHMPEVAELIMAGRHVDIYREDMKYLRDKNHHWSEGPFLYTMSPRDSHHEILHLETNRDIIFNGAREGFAVAYNTLCPHAHPESGDQVAKWVFPDEELKRARSRRGRGRRKT